MTIETMKAAVAILEQQGVTVTLEYPGTINVECCGWIYVFGDVNEQFDGDAYRNWQAYEEGENPEKVTTPLSSDHADPAEVAKAVTDAVAAHQERQEPRYFVLNETDGIFAHPESMTRAEADEFMVEFRQRFAKQGYYASSAGRIPVSELRLKRIPAEEV